MKLEQVRKFCLSLPEVTEEPHFDYTSFRVRGKIFATAPPGGEFLHVFVDEEQRDAALEVNSAFLEALVWGGQVRGLRVILSRANLSALEVLLTQAWTRRAPKRLVQNRTTNVAKAGSTPKKGMK